jgi:hypothetical protein
MVVANSVITEARFGLVNLSGARFSIYVVKTILVPPLLVFACLAVLTQDSWSQLPASLTNGLVARYTFSNNASNSFGPGGNAVPAGDFAYLQGGGVRITGDLGEHASLGGGYIELPVASYGISSNFTFNLIMKDVTHTKYWGEVLLYWGIDGPGRKVVFIDAKPTNNWGWGQIGPGYPEYVQFGVTANHWATNIPSVLSSVDSSFFDQKRLITAVKSSSNISLYLDGVLVGEATNSEALPSESVMHIGRHTWTESGGGTTTALSASIFEFSAYNRALSSSEVAALYHTQALTGDPDNDGVNNYREAADGTDPNDPNSFNPLSKGLVAYYPFDGNANDESGYGRDGKVINAIPGNGRTCKTNESLYFNGVSYVAIPDPVGTSSTGSIALWFKADSWIPAVGGPGYPHGPWLVAASGTNALHEGPGGVGLGDYFNLGSHLADAGSSNVVFGSFYHWDGWRWADSGYVPSGKSWDSVVATWSSSHLTIYINGEKKGERATGGLLDFGQDFLTEGLKWHIGASAWPGTGFVGSIEDVRFYDRTLTESDAKQLYFFEAFSDRDRSFLASNPEVMGHYSQDQYNANRASGRSDVTTNPSAFNLFTQTQFEANYNSGRLAGRADVTNAPTSFGLFSSNSVPNLRFTAGRAVSFSLAMPGEWTRYTQSESLPKGWSFNTNTGVLRGRIPMRGTSKAVITPSSPTNSGAPITIEFQPR